MAIVPIMSDSSSWLPRRKMSRSRSDQGVRAAASDILQAPPSPSNPPIALSPHMNAAGTPPKKKWEHYFKDFLTRGSPRSNGEASRSNGEDDSGKGSSKGGSRRILPRKKSDLLPPLPPILDLPTQKSNEDVAVRGGHHFLQSMFSSRERSSSTDLLHDQDCNHKLPPPQRRTKSVDTLDSTLRGGMDKALSPKSPRRTKALLRMDEPPLGELDEPPVHGGVAAPSPPLERHIPAAFSSSSKQSREMKKAFTEFHNSSKFSLDASSPYLGDDPSTRSRQSEHLAMPNRTSSGAQSVLNLTELRQSNVASVSLPVVNEDVVMNRSIRMLRPVQGPEYWEAGHRYLIAPAALSSCPLQVLRQLHTVKVQDYTESAFGSIELGIATCKYVGPAYHDWNTCNFLLKQNYLMEYEIGTTAGTPRGVAHLQFADCYPHDDFPDALELKFYGSPCSRADTRVLFMRVANREERDRWVRCLNDAAQLTIKDLYDYDEKETAFGKGRYAVVYPARRRVGDSGMTTNTNLECALKIIDKDEFWLRVVRGEERADTIVRETSVQATLTAKYGRLSTFLHIRGIFETVDHFVLELELLEGTDLYKCVSSKGVMEEEEAAQIMRDIFKSLDAMLRTGIAHRDIKPANVLMRDREKYGVSVKVADFGMSGFTGVDGHLRGRCGTPGYVAPEMWTAAVHGGYGNKVDVFSAGVTLYILLCGYEPFFGETDAELIAANKAAIVDYPDEEWSRISSEARDLVERMLERDPKKRISAKEALEHPWIVTRAPPPTVVKDGSKSLAEDGTACTIS